jgi:hypothetical protein
VAQAAYQIGEKHERTGNIRESENGEWTVKRRLTDVVNAMLTRKFFAPTRA